MSWGLRAAICSYFFIDIIETASLQCVRGLGDNTTYTISSIIASAGQLMGVVGLVLLCGLGLEGAVWALFIANFAALLYIVFVNHIFRYIKVDAISIDILKKILLFHKKN